MELKNKKQYPEFCHDILNRLKSELKSDLYYHRPEHTIDVANVCEQYIERYELSQEDAHLLRIAAVAHDFGYTQTYQNHEEKGAELIAPIMEKEGYTLEQIDTVTGMIMATKVPQLPTTLLEQIIADADLDYLGRSDYPELSGLLYKEFKSKGIIQSDEDWLHLQVSFLNSHNFHTDFAQNYRERVKTKTLKRLKGELEGKPFSQRIRNMLRKNISSWD
jgi:predicted metal-dependent HD superfamily phosphohydrolase